MSGCWIRNEWIMEKGKWRQSRQGNCLVNVSTTDQMVHNVTTWWAEHQWFMSNDLIIGIPPDTRAGKEFYLVVFSRA